MNLNAQLESLFKNVRVYFIKYIFLKVFAIFRFFVVLFPVSTTESTCAIFLFKMYAKYNTATYYMFNIDKKRKRQLKNNYALEVIINLLAAK